MSLADPYMIRRSVWFGILLICGLLLGIALHTVADSPGNSAVGMAKVNAQAEPLLQKIADASVPITRIRFAAEPSPGVAQAQTYELHFWPGETVEQDSRVVQIAPHPCGTVAVASVATMPTLGDEALKPERVVEFSADGEILNQWAIPVDTYPLGIQGDRVLINFYESPPLWIGLDSSITVSESAISLPPAELIECDFSAEAFPNSAYAVCTRYPDLYSGESRLLSFEGVCT